MIGKCNNVKKNNVTIALNVFYYKKKHPLYVSKYNLSREKS